MSDLWISVIIPTYNRCDSLRVTLDALGRQTMPTAGFEVLVVSDGSTDGTDVMLAEYAKSAPYRLIPLTQSNAGPAAARNRGIEAASGELIVLLDDDVEPSTNFLEAHAARHARGDAEDRLALFGPMLRDPRRREPSWIRWEHAMLRKQYDLWESGACTSAEAHNFYSGNASFRREWALAVGGFDVNLKRGEDVDIGLRMQRGCGVRFEYDPRPVGIHRPVRSFTNWLSVAEAYGRLDVVNAIDGHGEWDRLRANYANFNAVTRGLANVAMSAPWTSPLLQGLLSTSARAAYAFGLVGPSLSALSAVCNIRRIEGSAAEMGVAAFRKLVVSRQHETVETSS